jgi:hypothetical protein
VERDVGFIKEKIVELIDVTNPSLRYLEYHIYNRGLDRWVGLHITGTHFAPYLFPGPIESRARKGFTFEGATGGEKLGFH